MVLGTSQSEVGRMVALKYKLIKSILLRNDTVKLYVSEIVQSGP